MPTYEYRCKKCEEHLEGVQSFKDDALTVCPGCGGELRKVFGNIGIAFKGSGFYKTDSRAGGSKSGAAAAEKKGASSEGGGSSTEKTGSSSEGGGSSTGKTGSSSESGSGSGPSPRSRAGGRQSSGARA